jgi:hypothetical protein
MQPVQRRRPEHREHAMRKLNCSRLLAYAGALVVLLGVFSLYTRPDFLVALANQVWACF